MPRERPLRRNARQERLQWGNLSAITSSRTISSWLANSSGAFAMRGVGDGAWEVPIDSLKDRPIGKAGLDLISKRRDKFPIYEKSVSGQQELSFVTLANHGNARSHPSTIAYGQRDDPEVGDVSDCMRR